MTLKFFLWFLVLLSLIAAFLIPIFLGFWAIGQAHQPLSHKEFIGYYDKLNSIQRNVIPIQSSFFERNPFLCCYLPDVTMFVLSVLGLILVGKKDYKNKVQATNLAK